MPGAPFLATTHAGELHPAGHLAPLIAADLSDVIRNLKSPNKPGTLFGRFLHWLRGDHGNRVLNLRRANQAIAEKLRPRLIKSAASGQPGLDTLVTSLRTQLATVTIAESRSPIDFVTKKNIEQAVRSWAQVHAPMVQAVLLGIGVEQLLDRLTRNLSSNFKSQARELAQLVCEVATLAYAEQATQEHTGLSLVTESRETLTSINYNLQFVSRQLDRLETYREKMLALQQTVSQAAELTQGSKNTLLSEIQTVSTRIGALHADQAEIERHLPATSTLRVLLQNLKAEDFARVGAQIRSIGKTAGAMAPAVLGRLCTVIGSASELSLLDQVARGDRTVIDSVFTQPELRDAALALKLGPGLAGLRPDSTAHANLARAIHIEHERGQIATALNQAILARAANDQSMAPASAFHALAASKEWIRWLKDQCGTAVENSDLMIANWVLLSHCDPATGKIDPDQTRPLLDILGTPANEAELRARLAQGFPSTRAVRETADHLQAFAKALNTHKTTSSLLRSTPRSLALRLLPVMVDNLLGMGSHARLASQPGALDAALSASVAQALAAPAGKGGLLQRAGLRHHDGLSGAARETLTQLTRIATLMAMADPAHLDGNTRPSEFGSAIRARLDTWDCTPARGHLARDAVSELLLDAITDTKPVPEQHWFRLASARLDGGELAGKVSAVLQSKAAQPEQGGIAGDRTAAIASLMQQITSLQSGESLELEFGNRLSIPVARQIFVKLESGVTSSRGITVERDAGSGAMSLLIERSRGFEGSASLDLLKLFNFTLATQKGSSKGVRLGFASDQLCLNFVSALANGQAPDTTTVARVDALEESNSAGQLTAVAGIQFKILEASLALMAGVALKKTTFTSALERIDTLSGTVTASAQLSARAGIEALSVEGHLATTITETRSIHSRLGVIMPDTAYTRSIAVEQNNARDRALNLLPPNLPPAVADRMRQELAKSAIRKAGQVYCEYRIKPEVLHQTLPALLQSDQADAAIRAKKIAAILADNSNYEPFAFGWNNSSTQAGKRVFGFAEQTRTEQVTRLTLQQ